MADYRKHRKKRMSEINVVPYIDVMLVLLVIFMITAPLLTQGVDIDLPSAEATPIEQDETEPFILRIDRNGDYFVNEDEEVSSPQAVKVKAAAVLRHQPETRFLVYGDESVAYGEVVRAMVALQQAGVPNVGLITESPEEGSN
ncbi:MAG: protein TolR [Gammaproteobacteria bacterium]|nr:protein TolR [Gammaproteobacteria bacterium]